MVYTFTTDCIGSTGELINAMRDGAADSTLQEMRERCADFECLATRLGYDRDFPIDGDWHVSYHRSEYNGRPCFYLVWSAIEYIFTGEVLC